MSGPFGALGNHKVKVAVRLRPFIDREEAEGAKSNWVARPQEVIHIDPDTKAVKSHNQAFVFDNVFGPESSTQAVYDKIVAPIVNEAFNGFNGTVLCYGQTSSGKTHTLYGDDKDPGIITIMANDVQKRIDSVPAGKIVIRLNLIEIYNENVKDLLCSENPIEIVERDGNVVPDKAEHIDIFSGEDIVAAAKRLQRERRIGETRMNTQSSRSHTILRMTINTFEEEEADPALDGDDDDGESVDMFGEDRGTGKRIISAVLNFVDLAGSEKAGQSGASGERLREAGHINTSLSTLSKVVSQLSKQWEMTNKREVYPIASAIVNSMEPKVPKSRMPAGALGHISYRDSKLTRLLQSSLAGGALIAIVCNATPASSDETLSTLRFALSAKEIRTKPKRNLITDKLDKLQYENTIKELQAELFGKNEELKALRQALSEKNTRAKDLKADDPTLDRRRTFHFLTSNCSNWRSMSVMEEPFQNRGLINTSMLSADVVLKEFREAALKPSSANSSNCCGDGDKDEGTADADVSAIVVGVDREIQTDLEYECVPAKRRKLGDEHCSTPISTLRLQRSVLAIANEEDKKAWEEEKQFLESEISVMKAKQQELLQELDEQRKDSAAVAALREGKEKLTQQLHELKTKYFSEIEELKQSKEFEVDLLNRQVLKRDQTIKELKNQFQTQSPDVRETEEIERLRDSIKTLEEQTIELKQENEKLATELSHKEHALHDNTFDAFREDVMEEIKTLTLTISDLQNSLQRKQEEALDDRRKLKEATEMVEELEAQLADALVKPCGSDVGSQTLEDSHFLQRKEEEALDDRRKLEEATEMVEELKAQLEAALVKPCGSDVGSQTLENYHTLQRKEEEVLDDRRKLEEATEKVEELETRLAAALLKPCGSEVGSQTLEDSHTLQKKEEQALDDWRKLKEATEMVEELKAQLAVALVKPCGSDVGSQTLEDYHTLQRKEEEALDDRRKLEEATEKVEELEARLAAAMNDRRKLELATKMVKELEAQLAAALVRPCGSDVGSQTLEDSHSLQRKEEEALNDRRKLEEATEKVEELEARLTAALVRPCGSDVGIQTLEDYHTLQRKEEEALDDRQKLEEATEKVEELEARLETMEDDRRQLKERTEKVKELESQLAASLVMTQTMEDDRRKLREATEKMKDLEAQLAASLKRTQTLEDNPRKLKEATEKMKTLEARLAAALVKACGSDAETQTPEDAKLGGTPLKKCGINRGTQTFEDSNSIDGVQREMGKNIMVLRHELQSLKKKNEENRVRETKEKEEREKEVQSLIQKIEQQSNVIRSLNVKLTGKANGKVDLGVQCEYIKELLEESKTGPVKLPPEYPNVYKLEQDLKHQKNRIFLLESVVSACKCSSLAEKRKIVLKDKIRPTTEDMENSDPQKQGRVANFVMSRNTFVSKMGSAMDRRGTVGATQTNKPTATMSSVFGSNTATTSTYGASKLGVFPSQGGIQPGGSASSNTPTGFSSTPSAAASSSSATTAATSSISNISQQHQNSKPSVPHKPTGLRSPVQPSTTPVIDIAKDEEPSPPSVAARTRSKSRFIVRTEAEAEKTTEEFLSWLNSQ